MVAIQLAAEGVPYDAEWVGDTEPYPVGFLLLSMRAGVQVGVHKSRPEPSGSELK